jgi:hypothetical protein
MYSFYYAAFLCSQYILKNADRRKNKNKYKHKQYKNNTSKESGHSPASSLPQRPQSAGLPPLADRQWHLSQKQ